MSRKNKSGQEEFVGFAIIMVIIAIIGVIFLGIMMRQGSGDSQAYRSVDAENLLGSMMQVTSSCVESPPFFREMRDLVKDCDEDRECEDGRLACDVLEEEVSWNLDKAMESDNKIKGYNFKVGAGSINDSRVIKEVKRGNCSMSIGDYVVIPSSPEDLYASLRFC